MGLLSTPRVSSVPGEYNYFSAGAKVIITAGASGYCTLFVPSSHVENMAPKDKRIFRLTSECSLSCIISKGTYKGGIGERKPDNNTTDRAQ